MRRVLMGLQFFPRGGSAHVARNLARNLPAAGWEPRLVSGSLSVPGRPGDAREFYAGLDVRPVDMTAALGLGGPDAAPRCRCTPPTRTGRARRTACSPRSATTSYEHHVHAWARALAGAERRWTSCTCTT